MVDERLLPDQWNRDMSLAICIEVIAERRFSQHVRLNFPSLPSRLHLSDLMQPWSRFAPLQGKYLQKDPVIAFRNKLARQQRRMQASMARSGSKRRSPSRGSRGRGRGWGRSGSPLSPGGKRRSKSRQSRASSRSSHKSRRRWVHASQQEVPLRVQPNFEREPGGGFM